MPNPEIILATAHTVTIATGASLSGASERLDPGVRVIGFITDSAWDTNVMSFQGSIDGTNFFNLNFKDASGGEYATGSVVASTYTPVDIGTFFGLRYIKVRSGTSAAAVNQNGASVVTLVLNAD
jgi:hypothetical protein